MGMNQDKFDGTSSPGIKLGSASRPMPGFDVVLHFDEDKKADEVMGKDEIKEGSLLIRLPMPPGIKFMLDNFLYQGKVSSVNLRGLCC